MRKRLCRLKNNCLRAPAAQAHRGVWAFCSALHHRDAEVHLVSVTETGPLAEAVDCHGTSTAIKFNTGICLCLLWATPFSTMPERHLSPFVLALSLSLSPSLRPEKQHQVALFSQCLFVSFRMVPEQIAWTDTSFHYRVGNRNAECI